ncbi:MAG: hemolysin family protein [Cyanobacteria bacterium P01_H01_bin.121]
MLRLLAVFFLIAINAFFVTAEFSVVAVRRSRITQLAIEGDLQARSVQSFQRNLDRLLSTTQLGITLSSLALGWIGEAAIAKGLRHLLTDGPFQFSLSQPLAHAIALPVAFTVLAYLQLVLGELCPKALALMYPEQLARFLATPSQAIARIFNPFIFVLNHSTQFVLRLFGLNDRDQDWHGRLTPEELQLIISTSSESSGLEAEERELLNNVFEFADVTADEIMVPRTDIVAIEVTATWQAVLEQVAESEHSVYPVTGESLDDVRGLLSFKEVAVAWAQQKLTLNEGIQSWVRPAKFIQEYVPLNELLPMLQRLPQSMVIVVDEYGGTSGLVTLADLVEEIIGNGQDNEADDELKIRRLNEQTFIVHAQLDLEEVNDLLSLDFPLNDDYNTLGGFLIDYMQKIPTQGETFDYNNLTLTVISTEGPRLNYVQIQRHEPTVSAVVDEEPTLSE